jgi:hypothetical protein
MINFSANQEDNVEKLDLACRTHLFFALACWKGTDSLIFAVLLSKPKAQFGYQKKLFKLGRENEWTYSP